MPAWLSLLHASLAALWLGCVLTEVFFERTLLAAGPAQHRLLAQLHRRVDLWLELPALLGVAVTGGLLLAGRSGTDALLGWKLAAGIAAVACNLYCVVLVLRRAACAEAGDATGFARLDRAQHRWGAGVLVALLAALTLALLRRL